MNPPDAVALAVKYLRLKLSLTQVAFGKRLGLGVVTISRYERGHVSPSPENLAKLARLAQESGFLNHAAVFRGAPDREFRLPRYCYSCGAYLMGGATEHKPGCEILTLIKEA